MGFFNRFLFSCSVVAIISVLQITNSKRLPSKEECVDRLVESCNKADYSFKGSGSTVVSTTDISLPGRKVNIYCHSGVDGTTCYKNRALWFSCTPDHTATYKGKVLSDSSDDDVDDEICSATKKLTTGNLKSVFNPSATLEKNRKQLNKQMDKLQEHMDKMKQSLSHMFRDCFPFCDD